MSMRLRGVWVAAAVLLAAGACAAAEVPAPALTAACMPEPGDYTFMWWANGWNRHKQLSPKVLCFQTGRFGLAIDVESMRILNLGAITGARPYAEAVAEGNDRVFGLPPADLDLSVVAGGTRYRCVRGAVNLKDNANYPARIIESGRFLQRADILQLVFEDEKKNPLKADGRLEIIVWPDRLALLLELTPQEDLADARLEVAIGSRRAAQPAAAPEVFAAGKPQTVALAIPFGARDGADGDVAITAQNPEKGGGPAAVTFDAARGWHRIELPREPWPSKSRTYFPEEHLDRLSRLALTLANPGPAARTVRLLFDAPGGTPGITGLTPMLRDAAGNPTGIPVQISKNWHRGRDGRKFLYAGPWFHGFTMIRLPAGATTRLEFNMAWARWGGVPAASHAQLSLIGWGWNQLWDQVAIGSFGESICYDPDAVQQRCRIDDVRPLMVWQMRSEEKKKWGWTHNVGGGDFLIYYNDKGQYQPLVRMRSAYEAYGPNLTDVTYAGVSADGCIAARVSVSSPRCDDLNRAYHRLRYDVLKPTPFSRLAFYQLGSDNYHWHQYHLAARGNEKGMVEEWKPNRGGAKYDRTGIPCEGAAPWFSLHEAIRADNLKPVQGAWANRGLVIRSWRARLGGKDAPPFASMYGTEAGKIPSANLELSAPPDVKTLLPGDFVEAEVELLIMPMAADDYYGPNENLRAALAAGGNTWKPILRQAIGNNLKVTAARGQVRRTYPILVAADKEGRAEIEVTGGLGYVPICFTGLPRHDGYGLWRRAGAELKEIRQDVRGNDFWQSDYDPETRTWSRTYNVSLDTPGDVPQTVTFVFKAD